MTSLLWQATALVLVIEHRCCTRCKSTFTAPAGTFVRMESSLGGYHRSWLVPPKDAHVNNRLPHERREVHTEINACQLCFVTIPENQLTFWPNLFQPQIAYSERIKQYEAEAAARLANGQAPKLKDTRPKKVEKPLTLADL